MKGTLILVLLSVLQLSCQMKPATVDTHHFTLYGLTNQKADGTMLFLTEVLSNQVVDSMQVNGNHFMAEGQLKDSPVNFYLHTQDFSEYVSLWIEAGLITFDASRTDFSNAIVTGSKTQEEAKDFFHAIASIEDEDDTEVTERLALQFIRNYPGNRLSASMLAGYMPNIGPQKTKELYEPFSPANKESVYGKRIWQYITLYKDHQVGDRYSDFEMNTPEGKPIKLSDHLGKVTLIEFWASWCGPCRKQNPELLKTYRKYHGRGFGIVAVSLDFSKEDWLNAIATDSLAWHHVSDLQGRNSLAGIIYGVNAIPDNYLIDSNGLVIGEDLWGEELERAIEKGLE